MDLTKKSMKWLVAVFVVFAMLLTAVFAVGNVAATASADEEDDIVNTDVIVVGSSDVGAYPNLITGTAYTITASYYVDIPTAVSSSLTEMFFAPKLEGVSPTYIEVNNQLGVTTTGLDQNGAMLANRFGIALNGAASAVDGFDVDVVTEEVSSTYTLKVCLFTATYTLSASASAGVYDFTLDQDLSEFSVNSADVRYIPAVKATWGEDEVMSNAVDIFETAKGFFNVRRTVAAPVAVAGLTYNAQQQVGVTFANGDPLMVNNEWVSTDFEPVDDENPAISAVYAGNYQAQFNLIDTDTTCWADDNNTTSVKTVNWSIGKKAIAIPAVGSGTYTFNNTEQTYAFAAAIDSDYILITDGTKTAAGTYTPVASLKNGENDHHDSLIWADETTEDKSYTDAFVIGKKSVAVPVAEPEHFTYDGSEKSFAYVQTVADYGYIKEIQTGSTWMATAAGDYAVKVGLEYPASTYWGDDVTDVADKTINWYIDKAQITKPTIAVSYKTYNGSVQTYSGSGTGYTFTGSGTNFGTYPVTVALADKDNYTWHDGTTADYEEADKLSITKKSVTLTINKSASSSEYGSSVATITVSAPGLIAENDLGTLGYRAKYSNGGSYVYYTKAEFEGTNPYPVAADYILEPLYTANDNYNVNASNSSPYTITPKAVTLGFDKASYSSVYGAALETITVVATGLVNDGDLGTLSYSVSQNSQPATLVAVGEYTLTPLCEANGNYTVTPDTATYTINKKQVVKPAQDNTTFTYNGLAQTYNVAASDDYTITGTTTKTDAGSNTITISLDDKTNTEWSTGGTADVEYTFTIAPKAVTLDFYDSDDEEPWHYTFLTTYPDSLDYITVKATGLIGANDLGELGFTATNDETHAVADITVEGAPAGYYILTPTYTLNANYDVTALEGSAHIFERSLFVPVVVTDTYYYDGTAKAIVFDEGANEGYTQYYTITGNSLTEPGTTTVTVALKSQYAGNVIWGYDERVQTSIETTDDQTFTLTVNSSAIHVTFTCSYGEAVTTIEENVEVNFVTGTMRALPEFRFFKTTGWRVNGEGSVVTAYTQDMDGATLNAEFIYAVGAGDVNGDRVVTTADVILMRSYFIGLTDDSVINDAAAAWTLVTSGETLDDNYVLFSALDVNGKSGFRSNDIVAVREGLATGYDYKIINHFDQEAQISYQKVVKVTRVTVTTYDELVNKVAAGYPVLLGNDIDAATKDFDLDLDVPADIDLNGKTLTVNSFSLNNDNAGATLAISNSDTDATGSIYTVEGISITAPAGNVIVDGVNGYSYEGTTVTLAAYSSSLHIESNVGFYQYKVEGKANATEYKATVTTDTAINTVSKGEQGIIAITEAKVAEMVTAKAEHKQAVAAKEELVNSGTATQEQINDAEAAIATKAAAIEAIPVFKAPVSVPVDTHVVVEAAATLEVEQITVVAPKNDTTASTFSVNVKNDNAAVIKVDISEVKEVVEQVNVYHVEEVALEGNTSKVEIVKAEDQEIAQTAGVRNEAELNAALASDASVIEIAANFALASWVDITRTVTINGNGYTLTANGAIARSNRNYGLHILLEQDVNAVVTINDLNMVTTGRQAAILPNCDYDSTINLNNVNITTDGEAVYPNGKAHVYANNCTFTHNGKYATGKDEVYYSALTVGYAGSITAENCTVVSSDIGVSTFPSGGSITLINTDITITGNDGYAIYAWNGNYDNLAGYNTDSTVSVQSGDIRGALYLKNTNDHHGTNDFDPYIIVTGGTFDHDPTAYVADGAIVTENNDIYTVEMGVARIGSVGYATLVAAFAALEDGDTVTLLADLDFSTPTYVGYTWGNWLQVNASDVTFDLNNHTISNMSNCAIAAGQVLAKDGRISNFTIKNGTLRAGQTAGVTNSYVLGIGGVDGALIKNVTTYGGINVYAGAQNVVIEDCVVQGTKYYTVCAQCGAEVIIRGTTYDKNTDYTVANKSMFWTQGAATDEDMVTELNPTGAFGASSITLENGTFTVDFTNGGLFFLGSGLAPIVKGGTYNFDPTAYVADGYGVTEEGGIYTVAPLTGVAYIGNTAYNTFDAAVAAAQDGDTIVLLTDVTYGTDRVVPVWEMKAFDIDLNGKTFTTDSNQSITQSNNGYKASAICFGDYENTSPARNIRIYNGTIRTAYGAGVYIDGAATATLENLTVAQNYPANVQTTDEYSAAVRVTGFGHVIINSGSYSGKNAITISNSGGTVEINGGDFRGNLFISTGGASNAKILTIKGGTFDHDPTAYVPAGYGVTEANGIYTVAPLTGAACIGHTAYQTVQAAINAAQNGDTIVLLADVTDGTGLMTEDSAPKTLTIDFNGKTYTVVGGAVGSSGTLTQAMHWSLGSDITLTNGTLTVSSAVNAAGVRMSMQNHGDLTVSNMVMNLDGITVTNYGTYTGDDAKFSGLERPQFCTNDNASIAIINSTLNFPSNSNFGVYNESTNASIVNSTINGTVALSTGPTIDTASITIDSASTVTGGVVGYFAYDVVTEKNGTYTVKQGGARIGSTYYADVRAALNAAQANDTVVITANNALGVAVATYPATAQGNVTIDLAGHSVNGGSMGVIKNSSAYELTIVDTVGGGSVNGTGNYTLYNSGTGAITLNSGSITNTTASGTRIAVYNTSTGTFNMNGGSISGGKIAVKNNSTGTVNLYGGTLSGYWVVINADAGTINLDGATITSVACSDDSGIESQKNGVVNVISGSITARTGIATWNKVGNDAAVNVTGGTITSSHICISTNGNDTYSTQINVSGGTLICEGVAIYNAGIGDVTISGTASITGGKTGIEIRAGVLTVTGGTITSTADTVSVTANGNGTTTTGAGIAVIQHTTKQAITVSVTGGTITGIDAILEANPQNNSDADLALISITISGGTFNGDIVIEDEDVITYTNNQNA